MTKQGNDAKIVITTLIVIGVITVAALVVLVLTAPAGC